MTPRNLRPVAAWSHAAWQGGLFALMAACTDDPTPRPTRPEERTGCESSAQCHSGLTCLLGACVPTETPAGTFALRIVPPQDLKSVAVEVPNLRFESGPLMAPELPLLLPDRVLLLGRALTSDEPPVEVSVRALALSRASIAPEGQTLSGQTINTARGPRFTFTLAPCWPDFSGTCKDTVFTIRLTPDSAVLPPAEFRDLVLRDNRPEEERPFALPGPLSAPMLSGDVRLLDETPLHGLTVYGVDEAGQRVTTTAETALDGSFSVRYWSLYAGHRIRLLATSKDPTRPLPRLGLEVTLPADGEVATSATLVVPDIGATFTASGTLVDIAGSPVGGAHLHFQADTAAGPFSADALADQSGRFATSLYPGTYVVDVEPLLGSGLRLQRTEIDATAETGPLTMRVKPLVPVSGRVVWPDGTPLGLTRVLARLERVGAGRPELIAPDETPPTRIVEGETDVGGVFTLLLDPGEHSLTLSPLAGHGLPTSIQALTVPVNAGLSVNLGDVVVVPSAVMALSIADVREAPVAAADVQVWRIDLASGPLKVAEGQTDALGAIILRVPAHTE